MRGKCSNGNECGDRTRSATLEIMARKHGTAKTRGKIGRRIFTAPIFLCVFSLLFALNVFPQTNPETLVEKITRGSDEQKRDALVAIRNLETESASRIAVSALKDSSEIVRATAAASVIFLPQDEAAQMLVPLLADKKPLVRREAAYALGKVGSAATVTSLIQISQKDKVVEVRNAAIVALGEIGDAAALPELTQNSTAKAAAKRRIHAARGGSFNRANRADYSDRQIESYYARKFSAYRIPDNRKTKLSQTGREFSDVSPKHQRFDSEPAKCAGISRRETRSGIRARCNRRRVGNLNFAGQSKFRRLLFGGNLSRGFAEDCRLC